MNAPAAGSGVLAARWREAAVVLRRWGAALQAEVLEQCAAELEADERERALEALTLVRAALQVKPRELVRFIRERGLRAVHLGRKLSWRIDERDLWGWLEVQKGAR